MSYDRIATFKLVCEQVALGASLRTVCKAEDMPTIGTVMQWLVDEPSFSEQYRVAREARADYHFERGIEIVSEKPEYVDGDTNHKAGASRMDSAYVAWQRVQFDAHRWAASKLAPKKYADKIDHTLANPEGGPVEFRWKS